MCSDASGATKLEQTQAEGGVDDVTLEKHVCT